MLPNRSALFIVKKFYPQVTTVVDAKKDHMIEVTRRDTNSARVRNHKECALAQACRRTWKADGVIISVHTAYVIKRHKATRFSLPESVSREIVSFDRNGGFEAGTYKLNRPAPSARLGEGRISKKTKEAHPHAGPKLFHHNTGGIRLSLKLSQ